MTQTSKPVAQAVRDWMQQRQVERTPPPSPEVVRRQLGWELIEAERGARQPRQRNEAAHWVRRELEVTCSF